MAAVTSVMRVQQLLLSRIEDILKPFGLTFAAYQALRGWTVSVSSLPLWLRRLGRRRGRSRR
jgi:hypothetical protein